MDIYGINVVNTIETIPLSVSSSNLAHIIVHDERMTPIDFPGQGLKVKVTMDMYGNNLVNTIETRPLSVSSSNLAHILSMMRG